MKVDELFPKVDLEGALTYVYDIETDNLRDKCTKVHCMVINEFGTEKFFRYYPDKIEEGINKLSEADYIVGHNIVSFDNVVLSRLYPDLWKTVKAVSIDTLPMTRVLSNDRANKDMGLVKSGRVDANAMKSLYGSHSLEAWGIRLASYFENDNVKKGDFGKTTDWQEFSEEMIDYCQQDVRLNALLFKLMVAQKEKYNCPWIPLLMETELQEYLSDQEEYGCAFNSVEGDKLYQHLLDRRERLTVELLKTMKGYEEVMNTPSYFQITVDGKEFRATSKGQLEDDVYKLKFIDKNTGKPYTRKALKELIENGPLTVKYHEFNPNSSKDIEREFKRIYKWMPEEYTETGIATTGVSVLEKLDYPEAKILIELEILGDRIEKIAEGKRSPGYLSVLGDDGRLHGYVNPIGAITNRCSHSRPNLAQVPSHKVKYGKEFRELFIASEGKVLVGSDLSGIEMRVQAEYMLKYDNGAFIEAVVKGSSELGTDAHSMNAKVLGCSRPDAKTFYYGLIYGAGAWKLGDTVGVTLEEIDTVNLDKVPKGVLNSLENLKPIKPITKENVAKALKGREYKLKLMKGVVGLEEVTKVCRDMCESQGYLVALDGRPILTRFAHSSFNALLQSAGAIIAKLWYILINRKIRKEGLDANIVLFVHDEVAIDVKPEHADRVMGICKEAIREVQEAFEMVCQLDVDVQVGNNWGDIH
jgi:hypothetical protein